MFKKLCDTRNLSKKEWLEVRKKGIGGSDVGTIFKANKYKTLIELWKEKTGLLDDEAPDGPNEKMYWGLELENIIRNEFTKRTGIKVVKEPFILQHSEYNFMIANLDGICQDKENNYVFEAKTGQYSDEWENKIPFTYYLQLQHYLAVTNFNRAYLAALLNGNKFLIYSIKKNDDFIKEMIHKEIQFWYLVVNKTAPMDDGFNYVNDVEYCNFDMIK
jgi:putative phage-type endonuclease